MDPNPPLLSPKEPRRRRTDHELRPSAPASLADLGPAPPPMPAAAQQLLDRPLEEKLRVPPLTMQQIAHINRRCQRPVSRNVVATLSIDPGADVRRLPWLLGGRHTVPASMMIKLAPLHSVALLFANGRCNITGSRSRTEAAYAARLLVRHIEQQTGVVVSCHSLTVHNRMATVYLNYTIDEKWAAAEHTDWVLGKKRFRALRIRMFRDERTREEWIGMVLVFASGVFVITGARTDADLETIRARLIPQLARYCVEEITKVELDARKAYNTRLQALLRSEQKLQFLCDIRKSEIQQVRQPLYRKITTATGVSKLRNCEAIYIGCCFTNAGKVKRRLKGQPVRCEHFVALRYPDDPEHEYHPINKMTWEMICTLHEENDMDAPQHAPPISDPALGSPREKKLMAPDYCPCPIRQKKRTDWAMRGIAIREPRTLADLRRQQRQQRQSASATATATATATAIVPVATSTSADVALDDVEEEGDALDRPSAKRARVDFASALDQALTAAFEDCD